MRNLITAIARLLGLTTQPSDNLAQPTLTAGPASKEPIQPRGNKRSAPTTKRQPAQSKPKRKPKAALSTTAAKSRKPKQKAAPKASGATGKQPATRASKTRQHAK